MPSFKTRLIRGSWRKSKVQPTQQRKSFSSHTSRWYARQPKVRIVYDALAKASDKPPSLNDCLETGPPLQNHLWSVLTRNRFYAVAVAGDLRQPFLQVRVKDEDRNALKIRWLDDTESNEIETLRFTRVPFGLTSSPFLLVGVIEQHLENCEPDHPDIVQEIRRSLYVDDLIGGGETTNKIKPRT